MADPADRPTSGGTLRSKFRELPTLLPVRRAVSSVVLLQDRQGKGPLRDVGGALPNDDEVEESEDKEDEEVDEEDEGEEADEANRNFQSLQAGRDDSNRDQPQTL